jgi:hypothetical protein
VFGCVFLSSLESFTRRGVPANVMMFAWRSIRQIMSLSAGFYVATVRDCVIALPRDRRLNLAALIVTPSVGQSEVSAD